MPTFTSTVVADGYIQKTATFSGRFSTTWPLTVLSSTGTSTNTVGTIMLASSTKNIMGGSWVCNRPVMYFDLSTMPSNAYILSAKLVLYVNTTQAQNNDGDRLRMELWDESTAISTADFDAFDSNYVSGYTDFSNTGANKGFTIDNTLLDWLKANPQGDSNNNFPVMIRNVYDYGYNVMVDPTGINSVSFKTANDSTSAYRPQIQIIYQLFEDVSGKDTTTISSINGISMSEVSKLNGV